MAELNRGNLGHLSGDFSKSPQQSPGAFHRFPQSQFADRLQEIIISSRFECFNGTVPQLAG
jgi:hypothetical protein